MGEILQYPNLRREACGAYQTPFLVGGKGLGLDVSIASGISVISLLFPQTGVLSQVAFERTYGDNHYQSGDDARQTSDGGYIVVGTTNSLGAGGSIYLIKTDSLGDTLWTRAYGDSSLERARCVRQTSDGGFIIAGTTEAGGGMQSIA